MTRALLSRLTGKPASRQAFGVMQFGGKADADDSAALYAEARSAGITIFDAAHIYTEGRAEDILGALTEAEGTRDALILTSKCGYQPGQDGAAVTAQVWESLQRLRTDRVDILFLHRYPGDALLDDVLAAMAALYQAGAFTCLGVSNFAAWEVMKAQARGAALGAPPITVLQPMYNLVKRQAEVEILPMAAREGMAVLPYSPLGGGLLSGKYSVGGTGRLTEDGRYRARYGARWMHDAAAALSALGAELGQPAAALAVAWCAAHPAVSAPIVSASRSEQLAPSLGAADLALDRDLYARMAALTPTPPPATDRLEEAAPI